MKDNLENTKNHNSIGEIDYSYNYEYAQYLMKNFPLSVTKETVKNWIKNDRIPKKYFQMSKVFIHNMSLSVLLLISGKTKKVVIDKLGTPIRKELSVKPTNAETVVGQKEDSKSKRVNIEMWYYKNIVKYDAKRTYKETEVTIVNDRVMNIAFFNNK